MTSDWVLADLTWPRGENLRWKLELLSEKVFFSSSKTFWSGPKQRESAHQGLLLVLCNEGRWNFVGDMRHVGIVKCECSKPSNIEQSYHFIFKVWAGKAVICHVKTTVKSSISQENWNFFGVTLYRKKLLYVFHVGNDNSDSRRIQHKCCKSDPQNVGFDWIFDGCVDSVNCCWSVD